MFTPQEGQVFVQLVESVKGEKAKRFMGFCLVISDEVSLSSINRGEMLVEEARAAKYVQFCKGLEAQGATAEEIKVEKKRYEEEQAEIEADEKEYMYYMQTKQGIQEIVSTYLGEYELIKREVTCHTHCTQGSPQVVYIFRNEAKIQARLRAAQTIFDRIALANQDEFSLEDPGFYKDGELVCSICSHEGMGSLVLDEAQYEKFRALRIPHDVWTWASIQEKLKATDTENVTPIVIEDMTYYPRESQVDEERQIEVQTVKRLKLGQELVVALKEYAYQERENVTLHGWEQESIPSEIGDITTLKKLQIFDHTVRYLPQSLEKLIELECLRITGNQVEEIGFNIAKLQKLKVLDLSYMPLKEFPKGILELKDLTALYLDGKDMKEVPEELMQLKDLEVLSIKDMDLENMSPELVAFIEKLKPKQFWLS